MAEYIVTVPISLDCSHCDKMHTPSDEGAEEAFKKDIIKFFSEHEDELNEIAGKHFHRAMGFYSGFVGFERGSYPRHKAKLAKKVRR